MENQWWLLLNRKSCLIHNNCDPAEQEKKAWNLLKVSASLKATTWAKLWEESILVMKNFFKINIKDHSQKRIVIYTTPMRAKAKRVSFHDWKMALLHYDVEFIVGSRWLKNSRVIIRYITWKWTVRLCMWMWKQLKTCWKLSISWLWRKLAWANLARAVWQRKSERSHRAMGYHW
jgi:hypothetical protein